MVWLNALGDDSPELTASASMQMNYDLTQALKSENKIKVARYKPARVAA